MAKSGGVKPPLFTGRGDEDADSFVSAFDKYIKYREITEDSKKLNLFAVLLKESAAQWLDSLPETAKDTYVNLSLAFNNRYRRPDSQKFMRANELFTTKQADNESIDDYVSKLRRIARLIDVDDNILKFVILNGMKPALSAQVIQAKPESIDKLLEVARLAELVMPRATASHTVVSDQLVEIQAEMRRLATKVDLAMTTAIQPSRSPTPERRVRFNRPESPRSSASTPTYDEHPGTSGNHTRRPPGFQRVASNQERQQYGPSQHRQPTQPIQQSVAPCTRCARYHGNNSFCPARDPRRVCNYCHKPGHFQAACFSAPKQF